MYPIVYWLRIPLATSFQTSHNSFSPCGIVRFTAGEFCELPENLGIAVAVRLVIDSDGKDRRVRLLRQPDDVIGMMHAGVVAAVAQNHQSFLRLREEQAQRERAAADASAHERELAARLAAAEAVQQKLAEELTDQQAKQAAAEARDRAELEKLQKERSQREAELRAQIDREQATASALEKERLLREALEKDRDQQKIDEQARAERRARGQ